MGSFLPWGSLSLVLVLFLLLQSMLQLSYGCSKEERAVLLDIRSSLMRMRSLMAPDSWGEDDHNCCLWERVKCNNSTQRVSHLDLSSVYVTPDGDGSWYLNSTVFSVFHELHYLDLSYNSPCSLSLEGLVGLAKLRYLDLSGTMSGVGFPEFIGEIISLEVLVLNDNNMIGGLPSAAVKKFRNLRQLNMTHNRFDGNLPESLFSRPHLKTLDLSRNSFGGKIPISSSSGRISLEVLDLSSNYFNGTLPVAAFRNIRNLNLLGNQFSGFLPVSLFALPHLKFLDLSYNNFEGRFPVSLSSEAVPLEVLNLHGNNMSGTLPSERAFENLQNLRELYLSSNKFTGNIPTFLFSLPHIELLNLSTNFLGGQIINPSLNLSFSLKSLRFSQNILGGRISFIWLANLTKLEEIDLSDNANLVVDINVPGWTPLFQLNQLLLSGCDLDKNIIAEPHFLRTQRHLEVLDLSNNNLSGSMPNWLFTKEAKLQVLNLGNNSLTGPLDPIWHTQSSLQIINIHMNHVTGHLPANISSIFPSLLVLDFSDNSLFGQIPTSLCEISFMGFLDLSNNKLSGEVPPCVFTNYPMLITLRVSNNKLGGVVFGGMSNLSIELELFLDGNEFVGTVPRDLSGEDLSVIDLHDNKLSGKLDTSLWNMSSLLVLNLAGNRMIGEIHPAICGLRSLRLLDISSNNFTGSVPNCGFMLLHFVNLSWNSLSGDISLLIPNASRLIALDITHNQFTGNLHWVHYLDNIRLLSLGGNKFEGQITPNLCKLLYLRIIDLSHNRLSGSLPACIGNISFIGATDDQIFQPVHEVISDSYSSLYALSGFSFATKGNIYTYGRSFFVSMSGIDLSANMLDGDIPWELGSLKHIKSLNLSYNFFVGPIPATLGDMEEIESLDLSHNELSGLIPQQLTQLSSLGVFSVAYNNLSGCIPNSGQLGSFGMESYLANTNLHKITQGNMCTAPSTDPVPEEDWGETLGDPVLYVVTAATFVLAFWATVGFSFCHPYGRSVMLKL